MLEITITMPTWKRLEFLKKSIESLKIAYDNLQFPEFKSKLTIIFSCEPFQDVIDYIESISWINKIILKNDKVLGVRQNPYNALNYAFDNGSIFNLHLEDDIEYSKHLLNLYYYYYKNHYDNYLIYGFFCYTNHTNFENLYQLNKIKYFAGYGWACSKISWNDIKNIWFTDPYTEHCGWDFAVNYLCNNHKKASLNVTYPYTKHIGEYGTHVTKDFNNRVFAHIKLYNDHTYDINKINVV